MLLEGLADRHGHVAADDALFAISRTNELDLAPLLARLADERDAGFGAALFHSTIVRALAHGWRAPRRHKASPRSHAAAAASSMRFSRANCEPSSPARGLVMLEAMAVPPNDGGLSLGQAWVALQATTTGD